MREIAGLLVQSGISIVVPIHALLWFVATWAFRSYWIGLIACVAVAIVEEFCWAHTTFWTPLIPVTLLPVSLLSELLHR